MRISENKNTILSFALRRHTCKKQEAITHENSRSWMSNPPPPSLSLSPLLPPSHLLEPAFLDEPPPRSQYAWDTRASQAALDGKHLAEVLVLTDVLVDV